MPPFFELNFRRTPVTLIIAGVAAALAIVCEFDAARWDYYYGESLGILPNIWSGQLWRPFTTTLLHGGLLHAAFNIYWLVRFGAALEARFGPWRYLGLIVLLGYVSMLPQFIVTNYNQLPVVPIVGLSGILYGLLGMLIIGRRRHPDLNAVCDSGTIQFLLFWLVLCVLLTQANLLPVANIAHGSGLLFGVVYGLVVFDKGRRTHWGLLAAAATLLVLSTLIACPGHAGYERIKLRRQFLEQVREIPAEQPEPDTR